MARKRMLVGVVGLALLAPGAAIVSPASASSSACRAAKAKLAHDKRRHAKRSVIRADQKRVAARC